MAPIILKANDPVDLRVLMAHMGRCVGLPMALLPKDLRLATLALNRLWGPDLLKVAGRSPQQVDAQRRQLVGPGKAVAPSLPDHASSRAARRALQACVHKALPVCVHRALPACGRRVRAQQAGE